jgi:hypothetical protein
VLRYGKAGLAESDEFRTPDPLSSIRVFSFLRPRLSTLQSYFGLTATRKNIYNFCVAVRTVSRVQWWWALMNQFGILESPSQYVIQFLTL